MNKMNLKQWNRIPLRSLVLIEWGDAWSSSGYNSDDCDDIESYTVGWVVERNKKGIKVCSQKYETSTFKYEHYTPRAMVKKVTVLRKL